MPTNIKVNENTSEQITHAQAVREMFSNIAGKYDLLNHLLSANIDKRWRQQVRSELEFILNNEEAAVLDVACGTGDLSLELARDAKARILGSDFCRPMLKIASEKVEKSGLAVPLIETDALHLAFSADSFDAVTIAFGLRNLSNVADGLAELHRVLKPGGIIAILEFSSPVVPGFKSLFDLYFTYILPRIGGLISGSRLAYEYLPDSVRKFPDQKGLAEIMKDSGFSNVRYRNLTGGIAAIHTGQK